MLPALSSEEDIGLAVSTDANKPCKDGSGYLSPSRMATVSRARGQGYLLSCPSLIQDTSSDSSSASSSNSPEAGNSPYSTPYSTPPKKLMRGPPPQPPPVGPLPPVPNPHATALPSKPRPVIPKIQVSADPPLEVSTSEESAFRLYNPSRERFQEALDRVHGNVWHGSIRETKREHRRDCSMTSLSSEDTRRVVMKRSRKAMSPCSADDDEMAMKSLLSGWSLCECATEDSYVLQDNESGVLDTLDWFDPHLSPLPSSRG